MAGIAAKITVNLGKRWTDCNSCLAILNLVMRRYIMQTTLSIRVFFLWVKQLTFLSRHL